MKSLPDDVWEFGRIDRVAQLTFVVMPSLERWKTWARAFKREILVMYAALRDPRTPWYARVAASCVVAYAMSPIDLIPDLIPVLGYLDELVLLPLAVWFVRRLIPSVVLADSRAKVDAAALVGGSQIGAIGAAAIIILWLLAIAGSVWIALRWWR
jgi:uncharacterized membrane protein YkvA (DUF1232 family)